MEKQYENILPIKFKENPADQNPERKSKLRNLMGGFWEVLGAREIRIKRYPFSDQKA